MPTFTEKSESTDWERFCCTSAELETSYQRCRVLQVPVELQKPRIILPEGDLTIRLRDHALLLIAAELAITTDYFTDPQNDCFFILCDPELAVLKIFAPQEVLFTLSDTGIKPGTVFTEESCGTNALALAREYKRVIAIKNEQHFSHMLKDWWCIAGPVKDASGQILGYLDLSMHAAKKFSFAIQLLKSLFVVMQKQFYIWELLEQGSGNKMSPSFAVPLKIQNELTRRELEIYLLLIRRLTNKEIAQKLHISINTVLAHRKAIFQKLDVHSIDELLRYR